MHSTKFGTAQRKHLRCCIQLHGARTQRNHRVRQRNIFAVQSLDVAHHFRFRVIRPEHRVHQETAFSLQCVRDNTGFTKRLNAFCSSVGSRGKYTYQCIQRTDISCFIDADPYITVVKVAQIDLLAQRHALKMLRGNLLRKSYAQRIKISLVELVVAQSLQCFIKRNRCSVNFLGYAFNAFLTMIHRIKSGHGGQ
ncbi:hypothetical protein SDC9_158965 [bioreactor metagenome]|uniref:Uncharacterized protein n=1 Tax=bioreactor metagenome TaxID=1076179 RepID=A0A645FBH4_9ZZZZ